jgi:hypothetical protein
MKNHSLDIRLKLLIGVFNMSEIDRIKRFKEMLEELFGNIRKPYLVQCIDETREDEMVLYIDEEPFFGYQVKIKITDRSI